MDLPPPLHKDEQGKEHEALMTETHYNVGADNQDHLLQGHHLHNTHHLCSSMYYLMR